MSDLNAKHNRIVWCDIHVDDLDRACAFYEAVLGIACHRESYEGTEFAVLDHENGNGACLLPREPGQGATDWGGPVVYLNVDGRIRDAAEKTRSLGGKIVRDIHPIGSHGFRATIEDSEGNKLALHSYSDA